MKTLAAILVIVIIAVIGFFTYRYIAQVPTIGTAGTTTPAQTQNATAGWQTFTDDADGFSIQYPSDLTIESDPSAPLTLVVPKTFEPQTNFSDARLTVTATSAGDNTKRCFEAPLNGGPANATTTVAVNGVSFVRSITSDAGAGNLYDTTTYRALRAQVCYSIEYTIHSTQLANYPAELGLHQFDKTRITNLLDRVVGTFKFQ